MAYARPADLFDRTREWSQLATFAAATTPGLRLGIVSGRRRQGKSYLLRRVTRAADGLYHQAQEVERAQALDRFAGDVAGTLGLPRAQLRFADWETALRTALGYPERGRTQEPGRSASRPTRFLAIDELPYLLTHSPEIPSVIQELHDEARDLAYPAAAIVVCGSAITVMTELLSGTKPLRGRAQLDMSIQPFDYLVAARYWGVDDPDLAFSIHTVFGGTAGYKPLAPDPPAHQRGFPDWLGTNVLNPAHALFYEKDYLLREDTRIAHKQLYNSILASIAAGNHTSRAIGAPLGRDANYLRHPLGVLVDTGFVTKVEDMLTPRKPLYFLSDPIVRFAEVVVEPNRPLLEEGDLDAAWAQSAASYSSQIVGPHFEQLARTWTARYSGARWGGERAGEVGPAVINDPADRAQHEVDVVGLARGTRRAAANARVVLIGEAKASSSRRGLPDLRRLEGIRTLITGRGTNAGQAHLVVFGRTGFTEELLAESDQREDVHVIDLAQLYEPGQERPSSQP